MVYWILPVGERLGVPGNSQLEAGYLDAILASEVQTESLPANLT